MSEIDDIFARLGGGRIANNDQRDHRDIPCRGKLGGSRVVEVVRVKTGRSGLSAGMTRRTESSVRAQTRDGGFPIKSAPPPSSTSPQPLAAKAPEQVGHVINRWEAVTDVVPIPLAAPALAEIQPGLFDGLTARSARSGTKQKARTVADPFNPDDDRTNCLRCGYVVEAARERRGLMACAACAG